MQVITHLTENDYDEIIDFLGLVFGQSYGIFDFSKTFPKAYRRNNNLMQYNLALRIDNRIRGNVSLFPLDVTIGQYTLQALNIACVSTHPHHRGQGIMSKLMAESSQIAEEAKADFTCLGGFRQRYNLFGYEKAGYCYKMSLTKDNIQHAFSNAPMIRFEEMTAHAKDRIQWAHDLYQSQPVHIDRDQIFGFYNTLISYGQTPYLAFNEKDEPVGYLMTKADSQTLNELFAVTPQLFSEMICAWVLRSQAKSLSVMLQPWETKNCHLLSRYCESCEITPSYSFHIINWVRMIQATLELKATLIEIPDGEMTVEIELYGTLSISVTQNQPYCSLTSKQAVLKMDHLLATQFFFGPLPPYALMHLPSQIASFAHAVLPLPLSIYPYDRI